MTGTTTSAKHNSLTSRLSPSTIFQLKPAILLQSKEGRRLPIEICLKIVEEVVTADPKVGSWGMMSVSKNFYTLLRTYENSIVKSVLTNEGTYGGYPATLLSSWPRLTNALSAHSYPWLCEVKFRSHTIDSLILHVVTDMTQSRPAINLPVPDVPESERFIRTERFKRHALQLLYGMADSTSMVLRGNIHQIRYQQRTHLESLTTTELAILGVFVRVLGIGYFRLTQKNHLNKTNNSIRDRWIVFEDRVLRYGPFFAYATTVVTQEDRTIRNWSDKVISQALKDMEAFETGYVDGYASLQSVLWKLLCTNVECDMFDSWDKAKELVKEAMADYEV